MVIYLPIAFAKDRICNFLKKRSRKGVQCVNDDSCPGLGSPLKYIGVQKMFEVELQGSLNRKDSEANLSELEEGKPLVSEHGDASRNTRHEKAITTKEIATYGFYIAPLWFITEVISSFCTCFESYVQKRLF